MCVAMTGWNLIRLQHALSEATNSLRLSNLEDFVKTFLDFFEKS